MTNPRYTYEFSHEFPEGHSGAARSYWTIKLDGRIEVGTMCLHPREGNQPELHAANVCHWLESAFALGRADKQLEICKALGL